MIYEISALVSVNFAKSNFFREAYISVPFKSSETFSLIFKGFSGYIDLGLFCYTARYDRVLITASMLKTLNFSQSLI